MATKATDNRYSRVKYNQTKYGYSGTWDAYAWGVEIDWDGDGVFDGANDAKRMIGVHIFRGRRKMLAQPGEGWEPWETGRCSITLDNFDGRYDPLNTSSPLYPNVSPGKDIWVRVRLLEQQTVAGGGLHEYALFYGIISDIIPFRDGAGNSRVTIVADDMLAYLRGTFPRIPVQTDITVEDAINLVLTTIQWRWGGLLHSATDVIPYFWAPSGQSAGQILNDLCRAVGGQFFITPSRRLYGVEANTTAAIPYGHGVHNFSESLVLKDINVTQPWENRRTAIRLTVNPRTVASSGVIWSLSGSAPAIAAGATLKLYCTYRYSGQSVPATNVLQPVATTDWTTNAAANGSGADKTGNCSVAVVDYGDTALFACTNNDASTVYLTFAQINGQALYVANPIDVTYPESILSVAVPKEFVQNNVFQQSVSSARTIADSLGAMLGAQTQSVEFKMRGRKDQFHASNRSVGQHYDLTDIAQLTFGTLGVSGSQWAIAYVAFDSNDSACQDITTTFRIDPLTWS